MSDYSLIRFTQPKPYPAHESIRLVQAELDSATWASDLAAGMRARASERVSDGAFLAMGLGMLVVTLSALTAACASLGGVL